MENDILNNEKFIALTDDNGNEHHFEIIDEFDFKSQSYAVMLPFDDLTEDNDNAEVIILHKENTENGCGYYNIEDEQLEQRVFEEFLRRENNRSF